MKKYSVDYKRVLVNISIILMMFVLFNFVSNYIFGDKHVETTSFVVGNNDTLWDIAKNVCNNSTEDINIQNVVIEIKNLNNLKSSNIYLGQELQIPIYN